MKDTSFIPCLLQICQTWQIHNPAPHWNLTSRQFRMRISYILLVLTTTAHVAFLAMTQRRAVYFLSWSHRLQNHLMWFIIIQGAFLSDFGFKRSSHTLQESFLKTHKDFDVWNQQNCSLRLTLWYTQDLNDWLITLTSQRIEPNVTMWSKGVHIDWRWWGTVQRGIRSIFRAPGPHNCQQS